MSYNKNYLFTHNIDWYACINGTWIYAASRGGLLPEKVDNESMLPKLQGICANIPNIVKTFNMVRANRKVFVYFPFILPVYNLSCFSFSTNSSMRCSSCGMLMD